MTTTVQHYLDKGLRGLWYPVLASWEVQSAPVGITRPASRLWSGAIKMASAGAGGPLPAPRRAPVDGLEPRGPHCLLVSRRRGGGQRRGERRARRG